ncbi:uncharacterized protein METZ01_LOCUS447438, partial [marine metagenome]
CFPQYKVTGSKAWDSPALFIYESPISAKRVASGDYINYSRAFPALYNKRQENKDYFKANWIYGPFE